MPSRPTTTQSRGKRWTFTINNWTDEDVANLESESLHAMVDCIGFQREVGGNNGTPHLQGFVCFISMKRFNQVKNLISPRCHLVLSKGTPAENQAYCSKDDTRVEGTEPYFWGELPPDSSGKRTDIDAFKDEVKSGVYDLVTLRENHSEVIAKYPRFCREYISDQRPVPPVSEHPLRPYQLALTQYLQTPPDDRKILFIVDRKGNTGKTWFARQYKQKNHRRLKSVSPQGVEIREYIQILEPSKKADMAHAVDLDTTVMFINVAREKNKYLQLAPLEAFKDQLIFSPKYESQSKDLQPMHVVVLMNEPPVFCSLTMDRFKVWEIDRDHTHIELTEREIERLWKLSQEEKEERDQSGTFTRY